MIAKACLPVILLTICPSVHAATVVFKQGSDVLSSDGLISITNYQGTEDTTLIQNFGTNNYGGRNEILLGPTGANQQRAGVIRFDVTSLAGQYATIDSVTLRFTVVRTAAAGTWDIKLLREGNAGWVEGTQNGASQTGTACWNYAQNSSLAWLGGNSGARLASDVYGPMATLSLNSSTTPVGTVVDLTLDPSSLDSSVDTLTEIMNLWAGSGGSNNAGLQIYGGSGQWGVASSEAATAGYEPELIISYTPVPETSTVLGLGTLLLGGMLRRRRDHHS